MDQRDRDVEAMLERSVEDLVVSPAPVPEVLANARRIRRRRANRVVGATCAAVLALLTGLAALHHGNNKIAGSPAAVPNPPSGKKWAGVGSIVFAVPATWPVRPELYCPPPDGGNYVTILRAGIRASCVALPAGSAGPGQLVALVLDEDGEVHAEQSSTESTRHRLPAGWQAVPAAFPDDGVGEPSVAEEARALEEAGFLVRRDRVPKWGNSSPAFITKPEVGTPAKTGSSVSLVVRDAALSHSGLQGQLRWSGGTPDKQQFSQPHQGTIHVRGNGFNLYVDTDDSGRWHVDVPPGTYAVTGSSPGYLSARGEPDACTSGSAAVSAGQRTTVTVTCALR